MDEKIKRDDDGWLVGPSGAHHANLHQVYHFDYLQLCGCGDPTGAYNFCRDVLAICDRRDRKKEWIDAEDEIAKLIELRLQIAAHVLMHLLTHLDLLEHGGSVGGSWLTSKGAEIVDLGPATDDLMNQDFPEQSAPKSL